MEIRVADKKSDYDKVWEIFSVVTSRGDTYVFDPNTPKESLEKYWFANNMDTFVAVKEREIVGTYIIKANQIDLGDHIANCSYMVNPKYHGQGIGKSLSEHSLSFAKEKGFLGIQFNIVVSTNEAAIHLWRKFGFEIVGKTPNGFRHNSFGLVDTYIMYKSLVDT